METGATEWQRVKVIFITQMEMYIQKVPFLNLMGLFDNGIDALTFLNENTVDLMFVDIHMPHLSGMDMVKSLRHAPEVIFTTAYSEYAVEGFEVNALDYILKPLDYVTFLKSANKAKEVFDLKAQAEGYLSEVDDFLLIKSEYKVLRINVAEILYIEGMSGYLRFFLQGSKPIMTLLSMKKVEEKLSPDTFMRVHRSFIVNLRKISTIERGQIIFDQVRITVAEQYKAKFQAYLDKHFMG